MSLFTLTLHHPVHHVIAVWLLASASLFTATINGASWKRWSTRIAGWLWGTAGAVVTASAAGYVPAAHAAILAAAPALAAIPLTVISVRASRRYWRATQAGPRVAAGMPPQRSSRWWS